MAARAMPLPFALLAILLTTVACGSSDKPDSKPTVTVQGGKSTSPPATDSAPQTDFSDIGLIFTKVPDVTGNELAALETYIAFMRGVEVAGRKLKVGPLITDNSSKSVRAALRDGVKNLRKNDKEFGGMRKVAVKVAASRERIVGFDVCTDLKEVTMITKGKAGPASAKDSLRGRIIVSFTGSKWIVTENTVRDGNC